MTTASRSLERCVQRLCRVSREQAIDPWARLSWPDELDPDAWYLSPELCSLYGTDVWHDLDEERRKRLCFFEAVGFFSVNVHGERTLVEGIARRLYRKETSEVSPYLHHFLDEENKHMTLFGGFCTRYARGVYPERKLALPRDFAAGEEDLLFFARVLVFEEIVDVYNRVMSKDERLHPLAREINWIHHFEEVRHLGFGRALVKHLWQRWAPLWDDEVKRRVSEDLAAFLSGTWRELVNPDVYRDAGLPDPYALRALSLSHEGQRAARRERSRGALRFLEETGLVTTEVTL